MMLPVSTEVQVSAENFYMSKERLIQMSKAQRYPCLLLVFPTSILHDVHQVYTALAVVTPLISGGGCGGGHGVIKTK